MCSSFTHRVIKILAIVCIFSQCAKKPTGPDQVELVRIEILPATVSLYPGQSKRFQCTVFYSDENFENVAEGINWSTSPGTSGQINAMGLFTATEQTGTETITAIYQDKEALAVAEIQSLPSGVPTASFTITPVTGSIDTVFTFDASACSDNEDPVTDLQVKWDWEGDGIWDTEYSTDKIVTHRYIVPGTYTVRLEVKDTSGLTFTTEQTLAVLPSSEETGTLTDVDGNVYQTVRIGNQVWMAENLKVTHFRNGDPIQNVTDSTEWTGLTTSAYCAYNNDETLVEVYGYLYNAFAVNDTQNIAPEGWHVPSDDEWKELEIFLGMTHDQADTSGWRGELEGAKLKEEGTAHWNPPNEEAYDNFGFTALPGGYRTSNDGFYGMGDNTNLWTSTEAINNRQWNRALNTNLTTINRRFFDKRNGFSVRLIKD
ncbi:FISUMP domain-containing protein [Candidatus Latescibacterota bacterium]